MHSKAELSRSGWQQKVGVLQKGVSREKKEKPMCHSYERSSIVFFLVQLEGWKLNKCEA